MNKFICVFITIIFFYCIADAQSMLVGSGMVKGSIYDLSGEAAIVGLRVTIEGEGIKQTAMPDPETLEYKFIVPAGTYNITTEEAAWYPVRRANFRVEAGKDTTINLYPAIRITAIALTVRGDKTTYASLPKYDLLTFNGISSDLIIQFVEQKSASEITKYKYAKLTFNSLTISGKEIRFNKKLKTVEIKGNVLIDDNGQRKKTRNAKVQFQNGKVKVVSH